MDNQELQIWVEKVSDTFFGRPFKHEATFNPRLRTTGGRYFTRSHNIEISPHQLAVHGPEETEAIIKHELCHYHLHLLGRGYQHRDEDFKRLLAQVGATRHCRPLPGAARRLPVKYLLICQACGMSYPRKRRADPRKYACGRCRGRLALIDAKPAAESPEPQPAGV
ncbi:SprT family protein [Cohnella faecalis]|uniref:Protein SprT-like n=1 Tax=Cohnella faecalis TaxID=2315694 RepID=A0A398CEQ8_9BACL|nr:SprT family protein [Cohnella faecalis]RIE00935.1 SprT family protein [Cohnella faecalis]